MEQGSDITYVMAAGICKRCHSIYLTAITGHVGISLPGICHQSNVLGYACGSTLHAVPANKIRDLLVALVDDETRVLDQIARKVA